MVALIAGCLWSFLHFHSSIAVPCDSASISQKTILQEIVDCGGMFPDDSESLLDCMYYGTEMVDFLNTKLPGYDIKERAKEVDKFSFSELSMRTEKMGLMESTLGEEMVSSTLEELSKIPAWTLEELEIKFILDGTMPSSWWTWDRLSKLWEDMEMALMKSSLHTEMESWTLEQLSEFSAVVESKAILAGQRRTAFLQLRPSDEARAAKRARRQDQLLARGGARALQTDRNNWVWNSVKAFLYLIVGSIVQALWMLLVGFANHVVEPVANKAWAVTVRMTTSAGTVVWTASRSALQSMFASLIHVLKALVWGLLEVGIALASDFFWLLWWFLWW